MPAANVLWVYRDPPLDGPSNMARDEQLLMDPAVAPAALRLYAWNPPTISLGYFQRAAAVADLPEELRQLAVVRRQTGGGAILHDREVTYCLVVAADLPIARQAPDALYRLAHGAWQAELLAAGVAVDVAPDDAPPPSPRGGPFFCFERPGRTDLIVGAAKLLGSAQRRLPLTTASTAGRVLQHGSLILGRRFAAHPGASLVDPAPEQVQRWCTGFAARVAAGLGLSPQFASWTPEQLAEADERRLRFAGADWTQRR